MSKRAVIYARFSPRPDADTTASNEHQAERCRKLCDKRKYEVAGTYFDATND